MAGLDVTEQTIMTTADLARMSTFDNPRAQHLAAIVPFYEGFYKDRLGLDGICIHDSSTISYLLAPDLYTWVEYPIRVECGDSVCRGKTQTAVHVSDHEAPWQGTSGGAHPHRGRQSAPWSNSNWQAWRGDRADICDPHTSHTRPKTSRENHGT